MENEIREFFRQTAPKPSDGTSFTLELNARLAAVEQVKAYRDREIRRTRRILWGVFAAGMLLGGALAALLILHPVRLPEPAGPAASLTTLAGGPSWTVYLLGLVALLATAIPLVLIRRRRAF